MKKFLYFSVLVLSVTLNGLLLTSFVQGSYAQEQMPRLIDDVKFLGNIIDTSLSGKELLEQSHKAGFKYSRIRKNGNTDEMRLTSGGGIKIIMDRDLNVLKIEHWLAHIGTIYNIEDEL